MALTRSTHPLHTAGCLPPSPARTPSTASPGPGRSAGSGTPTVAAAPRSSSSGRTPCATASGRECHRGQHVRQHPPTRQREAHLRLPQRLVLPQPSLDVAPSASLDSSTCSRRPGYTAASATRISSTSSQVEVPLAVRRRVQRVHTDGLHAGFYSPGRDLRSQMLETTYFVGLVETSGPHRPSQV